MENPCMENGCMENERSMCHGQTMMDGYEWLSALMAPIKLYGTGGG